MKARKACNAVGIRMIKLQMQGCRRIGRGVLILGENKGSNGPSESVKGEVGGHKTKSWHHVHSLNVENHQNH